VHYDIVLKSVISELHGLFCWTRVYKAMHQRRQVFENLLSFVVETFKTGSEWGNALQERKDVSPS